MKIKFEFKGNYLNWNLMKKILPFLLVIVSCIKEHKSNNDWTSDNLYYPVYNFSDNVMGLTVELSYTHSVQVDLVDSIFNHFVETDSIGYVMTQHVNSCIAVDTSGSFKFYRNIKLEKTLLENTSKSLYLYCTRGVIKRDIKDVVFSLDECASNIVVFRLDKIDTTKLGQPIFCSKTKLNLNFENSSLIDDKIEAFHQTQQYDYTDNVKSVSYANLDSLYFAYSDDFNWNKPGTIDNYFPGRAVYVLRQDGKIYPKWSLGLDLLGIPCD